ncbi:MAG: ABC transporter ATP-binding protein [Verrucomicrobia bacterium]|nr:ABC transporter ATP-binding protein [Verrucomicrobiota bacterium]
MIHLHEVSRTYAMAGQLAVLKGVNLHIAPNEFVAILGASGSGKSTLLHILGLLDNENSGRVLFQGRDVTQLSENELAAMRGRQIGFVFQAFHLIPHLSVVENVQLPLFYQRVSPAKRREAAAHQLKRVHLPHRNDHLPTQLSGGECQRVAIARALVTDPALILADEPTGNLDSTTGAEICQVFKDLHAQGRTIILVTHDPTVAQYAHRIIRLADGEVVEDVQQCHS